MRGRGCLHATPCRTGHGTAELDPAWPSRTAPVGASGVSRGLPGSRQSQGAAWAWWTIAMSGAVGFLSFLSYLGHGYLDTWHGVGSVALVPVFVAGLLRSRAVVRSAPRRRTSVVLGRLEGRQRLGHFALPGTGL